MGDDEGLKRSWRLQLLIDNLIIRFQIPFLIKMLEYLNNRFHTEKLANLGQIFNAIQNDIISTLLQYFYGFYSKIVLYLISVEILGLAKLGAIGILISHFIRVMIIQNFSGGRLLFIFDVQCTDYIGNSL